MLTAILAVRNVLGEDNDLWTVNVERSYSESFLLDSKEDQDEIIPPVSGDHRHLSTNGLGEQLRATPAEVPDKSNS